jgi:hypothetical protein
MPGEGDVTALPLFRRGALRKLELLSWWYLVVRVGQGRMCGGELRILLSSIFGEKNPLGFAIFSWVDVEALFLASRRYTLSRGRT